MRGRIRRWLGLGECRADLDERARFARLQHENASRRAVVTGVDSVIRSASARDTMEALIGRLEERRDVPRSNP